MWEALPNQAETSGMWEALPNQAETSGMWEAPQVPNPIQMYSVRPGPRTRKPTALFFLVNPFSLAAISLPPLP